ncbi:MAG TPA: hypothetical protein VFC19_30500 [Candidatus Limnocylindrales bacterium]|nr:hypothetical protein [Candidatus Limnocylindrales bacterium]
MQPDSLIDSAKGWHNIQLAVMGFIGLCGVLRMGETPAGPEWLSWWSTGMSLLAFVSSLISMWMVGGVAFPLYSGHQMPQNATGRLKGGIGMTFASIVMMALGALGGWWPTTGDGGGGNVQVSDAGGNSACGELVQGAPSGSMWLQTDKGRMTVALKNVAEIRQVSTCL